MIPTLIIRPEPGCAASCASANALGLHAHGHPLFAVRGRTWQAPPPDSFDALLLGSANAPRHAGPALTAYAAKPCYAVGETTAEAARQAGLAVVATGSGGLQNVLGALDPGHKRLLRLCGAKRTRLTVPPDVGIEERVVYASEPLPMPRDLADVLAEPALILLHSAEAARHFAAECDRLDVVRRLHALACLAPRIGEAAGNGWRTVACAENPDDMALLALAARMCQERTRS